MRLCFDTLDEVKDFVKQLKGTRGGKAGDNDGESTQTGTATGSAPAPLSPPAGGPAFNPGAQTAGGPAFNPGGAFTGPAPEVVALVTRINTRIDGAIASGQPADQVLAWFRNQCGAEAANATMDQIKTVFLPKAPVAVLENIAKLMAA